MQKLETKLYPHPNQIVQDAYDSMIANLFNKHTDNPPRALCITGSQPGIGKTTIAINFSIALVMAGWKVAFIDGDLRKLSLSKRLGSEKLIGMTDYLAGLAEYDDILTETNFEKFTYIACGDISNKNPVGLLYSQRFDELMVKLKQNFDFIVFDTSALSANADASVISCKVDGAFLVVPMGDSAVQLQKEIARLKDFGVNILATILNRAPRSEYKRFMGFYDYKKKRKIKYKPVVEPD